MAKRAEVLDANDSRNINKAAEVLKKGGLVAFPTETVYGLGADALNPKAAAGIFAAKKRPQFDPLIVHVARPDEAFELWKETPKIALTLIKKFWPGPLTLILPKSEKVPAIVTSDLPTVAVRMPKGQAASQLLGRFGGPVAAPSANLFGYASPTTAAAVYEDLGDEIDIILDGGPTSVGIESTVLKIEGDRCVLLRPGGVPVEEIENFTPVFKKGDGENLVVESPGLTHSHYAPRTPFTLMGKDRALFVGELEHLYKACRRAGVEWPRIGFLSFDKNLNEPCFAAVEVLSAHGDLSEAAANFFQAVRTLDKMNLDLMVAEPVPSHGLGAAIMDRLTKATGGNVGVDKFFQFNP